MEQLSFWTKESSENNPGQAKCSCGRIFPSQRAWADHYWSLAPKRGGNYRDDYMTQAMAQEWADHRTRHSFRGLTNGKE